MALDVDIALDLPSRLTELDDPSYRSAAPPEKEFKLKGLGLSNYQSLSFHWPF